MLVAVLERRKRHEHNGSAGNYRRCLRYSGNSHREAYSRGALDSQYRCRPHGELHGFRLLRNERGVTALEFLITSFVFLFFMFAGVDYFTAMLQYQAAEHVTTYYLERVRIEGRLTSADETEMRNKLASMGMTLESITGPCESAGNPPVIRNPENPDQCRITMTFTIKPAVKPFMIGTIIGGNTGSSSFRIKTGGTVLSEKVY